MAWVAVYCAVGHGLLAVTAPSSPVYAAVAWDMQQLASGAWQRSRITDSARLHGPPLVLLSAAALWYAGAAFATAAGAPLVAFFAVLCFGAADAAQRRLFAELLRGDGGRGEEAAGEAALAEFSSDMEGGATLLMLLCAVADAAHDELCVPRAVRDRYRHWRASRPGAATFGDLRGSPASRMRRSPSAAELRGRSPSPSPARRSRSAAELRGRATAAEPAQFEATVGAAQRKKQETPRAAASEKSRSDQISAR